MSCRRQLHFASSLPCISFVFLSVLKFYAPLESYLSNPYIARLSSADSRVCRSHSSVFIIYCVDDSHE